MTDYETAFRHPRKEPGSEVTARRLDRIFAPSNRVMLVLPSTATDPMIPFDDQDVLSMKKVRWNGEPEPDGRGGLYLRTEDGRTVKLVVWPDKIGRAPWTAIIEPNTGRPVLYDRLCYIVPGHLVRDDFMVEMQHYNSPLPEYMFAFSRRERSIPPEVEELVNK